MEEDIEHLKELKIELENMSITGPTSEDRLNAHRKSLAISNILNELERLQKENEKLKEQVNMFDVAYSGSIKESKKWFDIAHDSIPKQVIRDKFKRINETKIKSDKINARNYMIFGDTERATGWFINLDYIEKILLDVPGYKIGE